MKIEDGEKGVGKKKKQRKRNCIKRTKNHRKENITVFKKQKQMEKETEIKKEIKKKGKLRAQQEQGLGEERG